MGNRTAKFISALVGSIIAGVPLAAVSQNAPSAPSAASTANAASDCLASPKGVAPQGQHWFYRLDRATKKQCWYLRAEGGKATQTAQTTAEQPSAAPAAPQSVQNAHAEYIAPQSSLAASTKQAPNASDAAAARPALATRWPDTAAAPASPAPEPASASAAAPAATQPSTNPIASPAPVTLAAADSAIDKPTGSLQTLLLVIVGALALAGLIASLIYRFAGGRVRAQTTDRRVNWDHRQDHDDSRAPWHAEPAPVLRAERPLPVDFDAVRPQARQIAAFSDAIAKITSQSRPVEIAAVERDETEVDYFDGEFEIDDAAAPQLAADHHDEDAADRDAQAHEDHAHEDHAGDENTVNIDIITAMLERLATEGPRLSQPSPEADLADFGQIRRGQSAARA